MIPMQLATINVYNGRQDKTRQDKSETVPSILFSWEKDKGGIENPEWDRERE